MKKKVIICVAVSFTVLFFVAIAQEQKELSVQEASQKNENSVNITPTSEKIDVPKDLQGERAIFFIVNDKPVSREEYLEYQLRMMETSINDK
jgi:putative transposon-encoded protein